MIDISGGRGSLKIEIVQVADQASGEFTGIPKVDNLQLKHGGARGSGAS